MNGIGTEFCSETWVIHRFSRMNSLVENSMNEKKENCAKTNCVGALIVVSRVRIECGIVCKKYYTGWIFNFYFNWRFLKLKILYKGWVFDLYIDR